MPPSLPTSPEPAPAQPPAAVDACLAGLDHRQRAGQLNQLLHGWNCVERHGTGYRVTDFLHRYLDRHQGSLGAIYGLFRADAWSGRDWTNGVLPEARAEVAALVQAEVRRAGGPGVLLCEEAPRGHQALGGVLLPVNLAAGATWRPALLAEAANLVSRTLRAQGVHLAYCSLFDVLRDPRWGRSEECFSEDPQLCSVLTTAVVEGMQGPGRALVRDGSGVGVVGKHVVAQGATSGGRNAGSAVIGPHDVAEWHLPPVRAAVRAEVMALMTTYNDVDGVPCCADRALLTGLIRDEWGFDGVIMADALALDGLVGSTGGERQAAAAALSAGVDLSLGDACYERLADHVDDAALVDSVRRVLALKQEFGLLDEQEPARHPAPGRESLRLSARRLAEHALVVLADRGLDRLAGGWAGRSVLLAGPWVEDHTAWLGDYASPQREQRSLADALRAAGADVTVHRPGQPHSGKPLPGEPLPGEPLSGDPLSGDPLPGEPLPDQVDVAVLMLGTTSHRHYEGGFTDHGAVETSTATATCGEGVDIADIGVGADDLALARECRRAAELVCTVVVAGRPHPLGEVAELSDVIISTGYPGPDGPDVLVDAIARGLPDRGWLPATVPVSGSVLPIHPDDRAVGGYADRDRCWEHPVGAGIDAGELQTAAVSVEVTSDSVVVTADCTGTGGDVLLRVLATRFGPLRPRQRAMLAWAVLPLRDDVTAPVELELPLAEVFPGDWTRLEVEIAGRVRFADELTRPTDPNPASENPQRIGVRMGWTSASRPGRLDLTVSSQQRRGVT